jgi:hypothetical protein
MENQLRHILRQHSRSLADHLTGELARRSHSHYRELDRSTLSLRCRKLVEALVQSAWEGSEQLGEYVSTVADGRFEEGFQLEELQRALRILEVNAWRIVAKESAPNSLAANLTALNTTMGFARDELARVSEAHAYVAAAQTHPTHPEAEEPVRGTEPASPPRSR